MRSAAWITGLGFVVATACGDDGNSRHYERVPATARLDGVWEARLVLERPVVLTADTSDPPRQVTGSLALLRNESVHERHGSIGVPAYLGTYDIDFGVFGFDQRGRGALPSAIAKVTPNDSVTIALDPSNTEASLLLRGTLAHDSIVGTWALLSRGSGGGGSFILRRAGGSH